MIQSNNAFRLRWLRMNFFSNECEVTDWTEAWVPARLELRERKFSCIFEALVIDVVMK